MPLVSQDEWFDKLPSDNIAANCGVGACNPETGCDDHAFFSCMRQMNARM
jgi:hypothetical protein